MLSIQRVLVPVDFSSHADQAVADAIEIARAFDAHIDLLHVWHLPIQASMPQAGLVPVEVMEGFRKGEHERLKVIEAGVRSEKVPCASHMIEGVPSQQIANSAEELGSDLIVMGTRGRTGLQHVLLGSVAERVVRSARCPVLTAKADDTRGAIRPRVIVVPIDFSGAAERALQAARDLAGAMGPAHLVLVHGYYVPAELEQMLVSESTGGSGGVLDRLSKDAARELEQMLVSLQDAGVSAEYVAQHGPPERVIARVAEERDADLIVMGTHGRKGLSHLLIGSVAEHIVRVAPCPVLTIRPAEEAD